VEEKQQHALEDCLKALEQLKPNNKKSWSNLLKKWQTMAALFESTPSDFEVLTCIGNVLAFLNQHAKTQDPAFVEFLKAALKHLQGGNALHDTEILTNLYHYITDSIGIDAPSSRDEAPLAIALNKEIIFLKQQMNAKSAPSPKERTVEQTKTKKGGGGGFGKMQDTTRVKNSILTELLNSSEELVQIRNTLEDIANRLEHDSLKELSSKLSLVSGNILDNLLTTRMRPVNTMLSKYKRVVHDLSTELDKSVNFTIDADGIELDINILEAINEPLTHIVRNSLDHGIETPADREAKGKNGSGHLQIQARNETDNVIISIIDDDKGIDPEIVCDKAIEKGILAPEDRAKLSKREKLEYIFHPGLSTAESLSSISGRGVGMNVVKSQVEEFQGQVSLESNIDEGTTIELMFPLTMATLRVAILEINGVNYALPSKEINQLISLSLTDQTCKVRFDKDIATLNRNGDVIPLFEPRFFLDAELSPAPLKDGYFDGKKFSVVIFETEDHHRHGLVVDDIVSFMDIIIKPIDDHMNPTSLFSGTAVLGDASLAMVFDIKKMVAIIKEKFEGYFTQKDSLKDKALNKVA